VPKLSWRI